MEMQKTSYFHLIYLKAIHSSLPCFKTFLPISVNFDTIAKESYEISTFSLFLVFDLEFDIDLEIETIFKCIIKKFKHTLQK